MKKVNRSIQYTLAIVAILLCIISVIIILPQEAYADGESYAIDAVLFPSDEFRDYVSSEFDKDENGVLSDEEICKVKGIGLSYKYAGSMKGVEIFYNLEWLYCEGNNLTELDVSQNTKLRKLSLGKNHVASLDLSHNPELEELDCCGNGLTELDVTNNKKLTDLSCFNNELTALDVSQNTELIRLWCSTNNLNALDVSKNKKLTELDCSVNEILEIDLSNNTELEYVSVEGNELKSLDVSNNAKLVSLSLYDMEVKELDISNNPLLRSLACCCNGISFLDISNNPNLIERYKNGVSKTEWVGSYDVETIWYDLTEDSSTHFWVDAATEIHIHSWDGGKVTTEATEDSTGVMTYTCTGCGTVKTEIIPKLPKKEEQQPVPIDPTPVNPQPAPIVTPTPTNSEPSVGESVTVSAGTVKVTSSEGKTVSFTAAKNVKSVVVPDTVTIEGAQYKVTQIDANAFKGSKIRTITIGKNVKVVKKNAFKGSPATKLIVKTKLLKKAKVKGCLKGSKIKTVQVKVGNKAANKKFVTNYKKIFTKANAGSKVTVK